jgi:hypothetical protein
MIIHQVYSLHDNWPNERFVIRNGILLVVLFVTIKFHKRIAVDSGFGFSNDRTHDALLPVTSHVTVILRQNFSHPRNSDGEMPIATSRNSHSLTTFFPPVTFNTVTRLVTLERVTDGCR